MFADLSPFQLKNKTVAVALSGGSDSMALLHYMRQVSKNYGFNVVAINVEHGIRGESSVSDSLFVAKHCKSLNIPCYCYSVDAPAYAKDNKLSIEQSARALRYESFNDAIAKGYCDVVATAHHRKDNVESVLLNLFRGTGLKGLKGINADYNGKIIRPFINVAKEDIDAYLSQNSIPFVTDETNFSDDYTRNFLRLNVIPKIKEVFPEMEKSVSRLSEIAKAEDEFMDETANGILTLSDGKAEIAIPAHPAVLSRAVILALKGLGLKKDWERAHINGIVALKDMQNGDQITLPKNIYAIREYDRLVIAVKTPSNKTETPFRLGETEFGEYSLRLAVVNQPISLSDGFYADLDKIPKTAVIRTKRDGDTFTKFGGGTKSLGDYLTDKKVPFRLRDGLPILASGSDVLCVFGLAISDKIKVDDNTKTIITLQATKKNI